MSGSPIIQDGKLIGAVTHVLVNSPDTGYGFLLKICWMQRDNIDAGGGLPLAFLWFFCYNKYG